MSLSDSGWAAEVMFPSMSARVLALKPRNCVFRYSNCCPASRGMCCSPFKLGTVALVAVVPLGEALTRDGVFRRGLVGDRSRRLLPRKIFRELVDLGIRGDSPQSASSAGPCGCPRGPRKRAVERNCAG